MDDLIPAYRALARHYVYDASARHDQSWEFLERMGCIAASAGPDDRKAFMVLLNDDDIAVRYIAAVHCLGRGIATQEPLAVLRAIASGEHELALDARIKLRDHAASIDIEL